MTFDVLVEVRWRDGIADPQGATIERSLPTLGFAGVSGVRVGKAIRFSLDARDEATARAEVDRMCQALLTNPVIEGRDGEPGVGAVTVGVLLFPGTNCEHDVVEAVRSIGGRAEIVWHGDRRLPGTVDAVVLPGGFAHGDYLRTGAIAQFSPIMDAVRDFAQSGGPVLGICNGFQILCESGMLPGALRRNEGLKFLCSTVAVRVETDRSVVTRFVAPGTILNLPINHFEGCYTCDEQTLGQLQADDRVVCRYVTNVNGSVDAIAGVCSEAGNVVGMMPHPERASHELLGSTDGSQLFASLVAAAQERPIPARLSTAGETPTSRHAP